MSIWGRLLMDIFDHLLAYVIKQVLNKGNLCPLIYKRP